MISMVEGAGWKARGGSKMCIFLTLLQLLVLTNFYFFFSTSPVFSSSGSEMEWEISEQCFMFGSSHNHRKNARTRKWRLISDDKDWLELNSWQLSLLLSGCWPLDYWETGWGAYSTPSMSGLSKDGNLLSRAPPQSAWRAWAEASFFPAPSIW